MAQNRADASQRCAPAEHGGGGGVTENMCAVDRGLDPSAAQRSTYDVCHGGAGQRPKRGHDRGEHLGRLQRLPAPAQIAQQRGANLLRQGKPLLTPPFAAHCELPAVPVNVGKSELRNFPCAEPKPGKKQKYRLVPQPRGVRRTRSDHPLHILCNQEPRNR